MLVTTSTSVYVLPPMIVGIISEYTRSILGCTVGIPLYLHCLLVTTTSIQNYCTYNSVSQASILAYVSTYW